MSNLFYRVHSLLRSGQNSQHEDFLTELFAEILREEKEMVSFLKQFINVEVDDINEIRVSTQKIIIDSRLDMMVTFKSKGEQFVLFFENKIEQLETNDQLRRYANHLKAYKDGSYRKYLVYVTKNYDPKKQEIIFKNNEDGQLISLRWYQIYQWLQLRRNHYIDKVLDYMEVLKMDQSRRFTPSIIVALQDLQQLLSIMNECMSGEVQNLLTEIYGEPCKITTRYTSLIDSNYYNMYSHKDNLASAVYCSFNFNNEEYPGVGVYYELGPRFNDTISELERMKEFTNNNPNWEFYEDSGYAGISFEVSLIEFLKEEDHVTAIQRFFLDRLNELKPILQ